jgi:hypothetical protein
VVRQTPIRRNQDAFSTVLKFQPNPPLSSSAPEEASLSFIPSTPNSKRNQKKGIKKKVIKKEEEKEEKMTEKRLISAGSAERNISAKRLPINQPNIRTRARASDPIKEELKQNIKEEPVVENEPLCHECQAHMPTAEVRRYCNGAM